MINDHFSSHTVEDHHGNHLTNLCEHDIQKLSLFAPRNWFLELTDLLPPALTGQRVGLAAPRNRQRKSLSLWPEVASCQGDMLR